MSDTKVLVIDDDDVARELLSSTLRGVGHEVYVLPSAIGATREIFHNAIDAVVVDVLLPDISGDKLTRVLRRNARGHHLAIILVSSRSVSELAALAKAAGADAVVAKSEIRHELGPAMEKACRAQQSASHRPHSSDRERLGHR